MSENFPIVLTRTKGEWPWVCRARRSGVQPFAIHLQLFVFLGFRIFCAREGPLVRLTLAQPPLIHVHAIVFTGWLALFSAQAVFAANGRLRWHLRLGRIGIAYGVLLVIVGLTTGVLRSAAQPRGGQAEGLLYVASVESMRLF